MVGSFVFNKCSSGKGTAQRCQKVGFQKGNQHFLSVSREKRIPVLSRTVCAPLGYLCSFGLFEISGPWLLGML